MNERTGLLKPSRETPLPWMKVALIGLILFGNTFSMVVVFPFLPFMTHDFYPNLQKRQLGYMTGYLGSAFSVGSLCAAYIWGSLADKYGRRPVLLAGLLGTMVSILAFGCSQTFEQALATRFMWGLLNGNVGVAKTYLAEILDDSNQGRGFAIIGMQAGIGRLFGPAIGGLLSNPAERYKRLNFQLFRSFPYLLPCIISTIIAFIGFIGSLLCLEETLQKPEKKKSHKNEDVSLRDLLRQRKVLVSSCLYGLIAFIGIMGNETFPLWALNEPKDGGFSFSTAEIGTVYSISAPFEVLYQIFIFPVISNRLGPLRFIRGALLLMGVMLFVLPFTSIFSTSATGVKWGVLCVTFSVLVMSRLSCFTNVFVLINSSSTKAYRARVNGIAQTIAAAGRIVSPALCAILFAWSESNGLYFPLNFHFVFVLASLLSFATYGVTRLYTEKSRGKQVEMRHHLSVSTSNVLSQFEEFKSEVKGKRLVVFLDYDGTLTPIVNDPKQALLAPEMKELLKQLKEYFITGIISGRSLKKIENFIGIDGLFYAGSHGFDITGPNRGLIRNEVAADFLPSLKNLCESLSNQLAVVGGCSVEDNLYSISVHYRNVSTADMPKVDLIVEDVLSQFPNIKRNNGKMVYEFKPNMEWNKGKAVKWLLQTLGLENPKEFCTIYVGDDTTDEDVFALFADDPNTSGVGILVTEHSATTKATLTLRNPNEVSLFLQKLLEYGKEVGASPRLDKLPGTN